MNVCKFLAESRSPAFPIPSPYFFVGHYIDFRLCIWLSFSAVQYIVWVYVIYNIQYILYIFNAKDYGENIQGFTALILNYLSDAINDKEDKFSALWIVWIVQSCKGKFEKEMEVFISFFRFCIWMDKFGFWNVWLDNIICIEAIIHNI